MGLCSSPIALICEEFKQNATNLSCTRPYYLNEASIELLGELSTVLSTCSCKQNSKEGGCSKTKGLAAPSGAGPGRWCNIGCQEAPIRAGSLPGPGLGVHDGPRTGRLRDGEFPDFHPLGLCPFARRGSIPASTNSRLSRSSAADPRSPVLSSLARSWIPTERHGGCFFA